MATHDNRSIRQANSTVAARADVRAPLLAQRAKRMFDIIAATVSLALFSPILLITAIAIKLDSRGPILIRQTLYGYKNQAIAVHKFRTARAEDGQISRPLTRIGRILRRTGIDELPQFLDVLGGDMSIIGPRPCNHPSALLNAHKPGITDWAHIIGFQDGDPS